MHRTRSAAKPLSFDVQKGHLEALENAHLNFFLVPRSHVQVHGVWIDQVQPHLMSYLNLPESRVPSDHIIFPVHSFQAPWVLSRLPNYALLDGITVPTSAQASTRTLVPHDPNFCFGSHIKTSICMTVTSAMRTISPFSIQNGPIISRMAQLVNQDRFVLHPIKEIASIGLEHPDEHLAKCMGCILRADPEKELEHESTIICCALVEKDPSGVPLVIRAFNLDSLPKRLAFLNRYTHLLLEALVPPLAEFGFAFEAHGQNTLLRIRKQTQVSEFDPDMMLGFAIRDFGGVCFHEPTWASAASTHGFSASDRELPSKIRPGSFQFTDTLHAASKVLYHTLFASHLHRLVRALDLHADNSGWAIIRQHLTPLIRSNSNLWRCWMLTQQVDAKAFIRMKCGGLYRDYLYEQVPNLLLRGVESPKNSTAPSSEEEI